MDSNEQASPPLRSANPIPSAEESLPSSGPTFRSGTMFAPSPDAISWQLDLFPTSSAEAGPARISRSPEREQDWEASDRAYGRSSPESLATFDPATRSWRTSQLCLDGGLETFSATWPRSGIASNGIAYRLPPLVPLTDEIAFGSSLPTPSATSYGTSNNGCPGDGREVYAQAGKPSLETMARRNQWPTPTSRDGSSTPGMGKNAEGSPNLRTVMRKLYPTPTAGDAKDSGSRNTENSKAHPGISLTDAVREDGGRGRLWPTPVARDAESLKKVMRGAGSLERGEERIAPLAVEVMRRQWASPAARDFRSGRGRSDNGHTPQLPEQVFGQLNPRWVEWLMGLPIGWTDVSGSSPSATASSRRSPRSSAAPS